MEKKDTSAQPPINFKDEEERMLKIREQNLKYIKELESKSSIRAKPKPQKQLRTNPTIPLQTQAPQRPQQR